MLIPNAIPALEVTTAPTNRTANNMLFFIFLTRIGFLPAVNSTIPIPARFRSRTLKISLFSRQLLNIPRAASSPRLDASAGVGRRY
jgi:hypothetical protein